MKISRRAYAEMLGPTVGDKLRLADTALVIEIEQDLTLRAGGYGEEVKFGGGKTVRDGMGQSQRPKGPGPGDAVDTVITNALIIDHWGIVKADIGLRGCRIAAIGKAGNPDVQPGVDIVIGPGTEIIAGEGFIVTPGAIDTHIHFICPQQIEEALMSGVTTMIGGGTGPATGTLATTCTPGPSHIATMLKAAEAFPMNLGFLGKGNASRPEGLMQQIEAGAIGLKLHEDWGTTPAAIDNCLSVAELTDTQVAIHTDTLNESGFVEDTIAAFKGRTIHSFHTEGAGGGHAPDIMKVVGEANVLPSSTTPTRASRSTRSMARAACARSCTAADPPAMSPAAAWTRSRSALVYRTGTGALRRSSSPPTQPTVSLWSALNPCRLPSASRPTTLPSPCAAGNCSSTSAMDAWERCSRTASTLAFSVRKSISDWATSSLTDSRSIGGASPSAIWPGKACREGSYSTH